MKFKISKNKKKLIKKIEKSKQNKKSKTTNQK